MEVPTPRNSGRRRPSRSAGRMYSLLGLLIALLLGMVMMYYLWPKTVTTNTPVPGMPPGPTSRSPLAPIEHSRLTVCATNLSAIGKATGIYMLQKQSVPSSVQGFLDTGMASPQAFQCPGVKQHTACDYFLHWPPDASVPGDTMIACDYEANHRGRRNVLSLRGTVTSLTEADFADMLTLPHNAAFSAALRQAEGP